MKTHNLLLCISFVLVFSSFGTDNNACQYAGSNIGFVRTQTQKALDAQDINTSRFFAYKALNAIVKSKKQFEACGCEAATKSINKGLDNLKLATRVASLEGTKILLHRALENALVSLDELDEHELMHNSEYSNDLLALNTTAANKAKLSMKQPQGKALEAKINEVLINYQNSLEEVVLTIECKEAYAFAERIFVHCEQQLLKPDLTEAKKYYNLRTKEITEEALKKLADCAEK